MLSNLTSFMSEISLDELDLSFKVVLNFNDSVPQPRNSVDIKFNGQKASLFLNSLVENENTERIVKNRHYETPTTVYKSRVQCVGFLP